MKYLLVGLVLIAGLAGQQPAEPAPASRLYAMAWYRATAAGLTTKVEVSVHVHPTTSGVGLSIEQTRRSCVAGVCTEAPVISGYTRQDVDRADMRIDPALDRAGLHLIVTFHNDVTDTDLPIRVDVAWSGAGPMRCDGPLGEPECDRFATATIVLRRDGQYLVAGVTGPDGILQRRPDVPTATAPSVNATAPPIRVRR